MSIRTATAIINFQALAHNYQVIKSYAPHSKVLAVLKANAYGHGLERIAKALPQADAFGVARINEAIALRKAGIVQPIVLLEGFFSPDELTLLTEYNLETIIHNKEQLNAITKAHIDSPIKVWLKIDTGMHRLGIASENFSFFYRALGQSKNVQDNIIFMSHLGCADDLNDRKTTSQLNAFKELVNSKHECSLANSAGICAWPETHFDWVRPGLMLYGVSPMLMKSEQHKILQPVMTLKSSLISVKRINKGDSVGYGSSWTSAKNTYIGVIAIGYGDGYPRHAENGTPIYINGRIVPLIGRVSMDMITVDLGASVTDGIKGENEEKCEDKVGDEAILWGAELPIEEVAKYATTIPYELLCNISRRVHITIKK
jgi:alanine racemase